MIKYLLLLLPFFGSAQSADNSWMVTLRLRPELDAKLMQMALPAEGQLTETKIAGYNALVWTPANPRNSDANIFIHGLGEGGTDVSMLYRNGPFQYIKNGTLKPDTYWFAFQGPKSTWINNQMVTKVMDSILRRYPVDTFNLTGLSMGGAAIYRVIQESKHAGRIRNAVIFSMDRGAEIFLPEKYSRVNLWLFRGNTDGYRAMPTYVTKLTALGYTAKYFEYIGGHCCWSTYYNPNWKTNGVGVYDWLAQSTTTKPPPPADPNTPPVVVTSLPLEISIQPITITLNAVVTDDKPGVTYLWTGTGGKIESPATLTTDVSGLTIGEYTFTLTAKDAGGLTAIGTYKVTVK